MGTVKISNHFISGIVFFSSHKIPVRAIPFLKAGIAVITLVENGYSMFGQIHDLQKHVFIGRRRTDTDVIGNPLCQIHFGKNLGPSLFLSAEWVASCAFENILEKCDGSGIEDFHPGRIDLSAYFQPVSLQACFIMLIKL